MKKGTEKMKVYDIFLNLIERFFKPSCYYVGNGELLPPPLKSDEEEEYISLLPDENAKNTLIEHNLRLVVYIAKKFENTGISLEDLSSIGTIGLIKAVNSFNSEKAIKLATYASRCIENEILMYLRKTSNKRIDLSLDEPLSMDGEGNDLLLSDILGTDSDIIHREIENKFEKEQLLCAVDNLKEREKIIIGLRFGIFGNEEKTQKEVADIMGISQSYISRLERKIIKKLKRNIEKNN